MAHGTDVLGVGEEMPVSTTRCANVEGFSVHANVAVGAVPQRENCSLLTNRNGCMEIRAFEIRAGGKSGAKTICVLAPSLCWTVHRVLQPNEKGPLVAALIAGGGFEPPTFGL